MRVFATVCGLVAAALCGGCLQQEVTESIYLTPGGVVWSVIERDVRSDKQETAGRIREESDYFLAAAAGNHPVAQALRRLGARQVTTTWLRSERPYSVMTEGRFADIRQLATAIVRDAGAQGDATLVHEGCVTRFSMRVDLNTATDPDDHAADALIAELDSYRIVLTEGRFVSADGFRILDDAVAMPDAGKKAADGVLTLALTWASEGCVAKW
jgi:hypothetical protein